MQNTEDNFSVVLAQLQNIVAMNIHLLQGTTLEGLAVAWLDALMELKLDPEKLDFYYKQALRNRAVEGTMRKLSFEDIIAAANSEVKYTPSICNLCHGTGTITKFSLISKTETVSKCFCSK
jgi:hypothetical protein